MARPKNIILKNTTGSNMIIRGRRIKSGQQRDFTTYYLNLIYDDEPNITALINAGDVVVNDGTQDLSAADGITYIFAQFDTVDGKVGASATGVVGKLFEIPFQRNGSVANDWLLTDDLPTNQTPIIVPFDCKLVALSFSNRDEGSKTELQFKSVPEGSGPSPSTLKLTWILDDVRTARKSNFGSPAITFLQGDKVAVFAKKRDVQVDPKDVKVVMHFMATSGGETESIENWGGDIT